MQTAFSRLAGLSDAHSFHVLVDVFPVFEATRNPRSLEHRRIVREESARLGFLFLDLQGAFDACHDRDSAPLGLDVLHPTATGHRCAADATARFITDNLARGD